MRAHKSRVLALAALFAPLCVNANSFDISNMTEQAERKQFTAEFTKSSIKYGNV
ncbi:hypothetical protein ACU5DF_17840 [Aliivibrio wodanis]|uniref:hypothetical protein n=1 Tax=Aliivibrio wodanis TaxID=80852 RepID=UPI00406D1653